MSGRSSTRTERAASAAALVALAARVALQEALARGARAAEPLKVAAAADLAFAFKDVGDAYEKKTGQQGDLLVRLDGPAREADRRGRAVRRLRRRQRLVRRRRGQGRRLRRRLASRSTPAAASSCGRRKDAGVAPPKTLADLADERVVKIAIANPEHAPYGQGRASRRWRRRASGTGCSRAVVYGENVQQTLQFAQSGNAEVAIVALSLAVVNDGERRCVDRRRAARAASIRRSSVHAARTPSAARARAFTAFVSSAEGRAIMRKYGFLLPGETHDRRRAVTVASSACPTGSRSSSASRSPSIATLLGDVVGIGVAHRPAG